MQNRADYFRNIMDKTSFGSKEYRQAQMIFRWLCKMARRNYDSTASANSLSVSKTEKKLGEKYIRIPHDWAHLLYRDTYHDNFIK